MWSRINIHKSPLQIVFVSFKYFTRINGLMEMKTKIITNTYEIQKDIIQDEQRIITLYASTNDLDRQGDTIQPTAWDQNKIIGKPILFNHDPNQIVGKIISVNTNNRGLVIQAWISETAKDIWTWIKEGILNSASVGFIGLEGEKIETGINYTKCDMLETSLTPCPANEYSVILAYKSLAVTPEGIEFCDNKLKEFESEAKIIELNEKIIEMTENMKTINADAELKLAEIESLKNSLKIADELIEVIEEKEIEETTKTNIEIKNRIESLLNTVNSFTK